MIEVTIHAQNGTEIKKALLPESWAELNAHQLKVYAQLLYPYRRKVFIYAEDGSVNVPEGREDLFARIKFGLLVSFLEIPANKLDLIDYSVVHKLLEEEKVLHFLWEKYDLEINPLKSFTTRKTEYFGATELSQLTFEEIQQTERAFIAYKQAEAQCINLSNSRDQFEIKHRYKVAMLNKQNKGHEANKAS